MRRTNQIIITTLTITLLTGTIYLLYSYFGSGWNGFGVHHMRFGMRGFGGMGIMMLFFWGFVIVAMVVLINRLLHLNNEKDRDSNSGQNALELLKKRYASGEINKNEFEAIRKDLQQS